MFKMSMVGTDVCKYQCYSYIDCVSFIIYHILKLYFSVKFCSDVQAGHVDVHVVVHVDVHVVVHVDVHVDVHVVVRSTRSSQCTWLTFVCVIR